MLTIRDIPADGVVREPGLYRMTAEQYFADPVCEPSLNCGTIKTILERTPRHAFVGHPRLGALPVEGEESEDDSTPAQVLGTVVHAMTLGAGREWQALDFDSFRTKAARTERDSAIRLGFTPILKHRFERAELISAGARRSIELIDGGPHMLATALPEIVCIWTEQVWVDGETVTIWCRSMMDWCPTEPERGIWNIGDLKTTAEILKPDALARKMVVDGYDIQAAFYSRGFQTVVLEAEGRTTFNFWFAEVLPPFLAARVQCSGLMANSAEQKVIAGLHIWAQCLTRCDWPGYPTDVMRLEPPKYLDDQWRAREEHDPLILAALNPHAWRKAA